MSVRLSLVSALVLSIPLVIVAACDVVGPGGGQGGADDDDTNGPPPSSILLVGPASEANDVAPTELIWVRFDVAPDTVDLTLDPTLAGGIEMAESGRRITFAATESLAPSTTYTATVSWNSSGVDDSAPWSFTTGPYGEVLEQDAIDTLIGTTYEMNLAGADFIQPKGIGGVLGGVLADTPLMFTMLDTSDLGAGTVHLLGAVGLQKADPVEQDLCSSTLPFTYGTDGALGGGDDTNAEWVNPEISMEGSDLRLVVAGNVVNVFDMAFSAVFHPDGTRYAAGSFRGGIDARDIRDLGETICDLATCQPCDSDGEPWCLDLEAVNVRGVVYDFEIVPRTCNEIIQEDLDDVGCEGGAEAYTEEGVEGYPGCATWL